MASLASILSAAGRRSRSGRAVCSDPQPNSRSALWHAFAARDKSSTEAMNSGNTRQAVQIFSIPCTEQHQILVCLPTQPELQEQLTQRQISFANSCAHAELWPGYVTVGSATKCANTPQKSKARLREEKYAGRSSMKSIRQCCLLLVASEIASVSDTDSRITHSRRVCHREDLASRGEPCLSCKAVPASQRKCYRAIPALASFFFLHRGPHSFIRGTVNFNTADEDQLPGEDFRKG